MSERSAAFRRRKMFLKKREAVHRLISHSVEPDRRLVGIWSRSPRGASNALCGNPRRYLGERTLQERKAEESLHSQIEELEGGPIS